MSFYATLAVAVLEVMLARGELPRVAQTCIDLARAGNLVGLRWARSVGVPFDAERCLAVATNKDVRAWIQGESGSDVLDAFRASVRTDPFHLIPLAAISVVKLCANPIPHLVRRNKPSDFGEIAELPF
jgi:hypothetical protein